MRLTDQLEPLYLNIVNITYKFIYLVLTDVSIYAIVIHKLLKIKKHKKRLLH